MTSSNTTRTIALMSPGDMGHAVGACLRRHGVRVITMLKGRSRRTADLAAAAGIENVDDDVDLVTNADLLLSIVAPAEAPALAERFAGAIEKADSALVYVDCNAVAPETAAVISTLIEGAGAGFVDAGIVGPPPRSNSHATRFYMSGQGAEDLTWLNDAGLDVRVIGDTIGAASALKMCYAALNKGTIALMTAIAVMSTRFSVADAFHDELALSQDAALRRMQQQVPAMIPKAHRWIGEMEEIAKTFGSAGLSPEIFQGIADIYRLVADHPIAATSTEAWRLSGRPYQDVVSLLSMMEK